MTARKPKETRVVTHFEVWSVRDGDGMPATFRIERHTEHQVRTRGGRWATDLSPDAPFTPTETVTEMTRKQLAEFIGEAAAELARS